MSHGSGQAFVQQPPDTIVPYTFIQNCAWVFAVSYLTTLSAIWKTGFKSMWNVQSLWSWFYV